MQDKRSKEIGMPKPGKRAQQQQQPGNGKQHAAPGKKASLPVESVTTTQSSTMSNAADEAAQACQPMPVSALLKVIDASLALPAPQADDSVELLRAMQAYITDVTGAPLASAVAASPAAPVPAFSAASQTTAGGAAAEASAAPGGDQLSDTAVLEPQPCVPTAALGQAAAARVAAGAPADSATAAAMRQASHRMAAALQRLQPGRAPSVAQEPRDGVAPPLNGTTGAAAAPEIAAGWAKDLSLIQSMIAGGLPDSEAEFVAKLSTELLSAPPAAGGRGVGLVAAMDAHRKSAQAHFDARAAVAEGTDGGAPAAYQLPAVLPVSAMPAPQAAPLRAPAEGTVDAVEEDAEYVPDDPAPTVNSAGSVAANAPPPRFAAPASGEGAALGTTPGRPAAVPAATGVPAHTTADCSPHVAARIAPFLLQPYGLLESLRSGASPGGGAFGPARVGNRTPAPRAPRAPAPAAPQAKAVAQAENGDAAPRVVTRPRETDAPGSSRDPAADSALGGAVRSASGTVGSAGSEDDSADAAKHDPPRVGETVTEQMASAEGEQGGGADADAARAGVAPADRIVLGRPHPQQAGSSDAPSAAAARASQDAQPPARRNGVSAPWQSILDLLSNAGPQPPHAESPDPADGSAWSSAEHETGSVHSEVASSHAGLAPSQPPMSKSKRKRNKRLNRAAAK